VKDNTPFGVEQKTIRRDGARRTAPTTGITVFASLHHLYFPPVIFLAGQIRVEADQLEETPHAWNIADVVSSIRAESTSHS
jgi:hypothetical protein